MSLRSKTNRITELPRADRGRLHAVLAAGVAAKNVLPKQASVEARMVIDGRALQQGYMRSDVLVPPEHRELFYTELFLAGLRDRASEREWPKQDEIMAAFLALREQLYVALEGETITRGAILARIREPVLVGWFIVSETERYGALWDRIEYVKEETEEQYFAGKITMEQAVSRFVKHALDTSPVDP
jgi:hypothetical protein